MSKCGAGAGGFDRLHQWLRQAALVLEYRPRAAAVKGIVAMSVNNRKAKLVASFPVEDPTRIMLVTDKGQLIPLSGRGYPHRRRSTQGVIVSIPAEDEHVVSVEHIGRTPRTGTGTGTALSHSGPCDGARASTDVQLHIGE